MTGLPFEAAMALTEHPDVEEDLWKLINGRDKAAISLWVQRGTF